MLLGSLTCEWIPHLSALRTRKRGGSDRQKERAVPDCPCHSFSISGMRCHGSRRASRCSARVAASDDFSASFDTADIRGRTCSPGRTEHSLTDESQASVCTIRRQQAPRRRVAKSQKELRVPVRRGQTRLRSGSQWAHRHGNARIE